jgi:putative ABC transport system permease protein
MSWALGWRFARRELRSGLKGFGVFLACLALGVAAISAVGMVRSAIERGLSDQGAMLLGGDAQVEFTYRFANEGERAWMLSKSLSLSEIVDFRSMAVVEDARVLAQVKAVDSAHPLYGAVQLEGGLDLDAALAAQDLPGAVMEKILADQLGIAAGGRFKLGLQEFRLNALLLREPDSATSGFALAPRVIVLREGLAQSGLLVEGTLFDSAYRMTLPADTDLAALEAEAEAKFREQGLRWTDKRRAAPGAERFVERIGAFLVLVVLAGLAVGGVGVASAVRAYLEGKVSTIATLRTLGAESGLIFRIYVLQIAVLTGLALLLGLGLGAALPVALGPWIEAMLPFPAEVGFYPRPVIEALFYGITSAFLFALWPLAKAAEVRAAALYRGGLGAGWPRGIYLLLIAGLAALLIGGAVFLSGMAWLALSVAGGIAGALIALTFAALGLTALARRLGRSRFVRGRVALRLALAAIGGPRAETMQVVLALGLGLSVLAAVGQIDANLRAAIARDLPARAPSFFFVDIQPDQIEEFRQIIEGNPAVSRIEAAPMLRGLVTLINGIDAREAAQDHWVVSGDRGLTYAGAKPDSTKITAGEWWPEGYDGPPQVSFAAEEAAEMGLVLGDMITINVLGREIEGEITSFRDVDFSSGGMGFVLTMNEGALKGAPHSYIATVYAEEAAEAAILRQTSREFPNITAIGMKAAIGRISETLTAIAQAVTIAALVTLVTGFVVLIGAAAAGERQRRYEAAVLKVIGASRARILGSFALRAALTGAAAGLVAIVTGAVSGWAVMVFVMESDFAFEPQSAVLIIIGGIFATLISGLVFMIRPLGLRPAQVLRSQE